MIIMKDKEIKRKLPWCIRKKIFYDHGNIYISPCFGECSNNLKKYDYRYFLDNIKETIDDYLESYQKEIIKNKCSLLCVHSKTRFLFDSTDNIQISIDYSCNLKCRFCCHADERSNMTHEEIIYRQNIYNEILKKILEYDFSNVKLIGNDDGEPFADDYFKNKWL